MPDAPGAIARRSFVLHGSSALAAVAGFPFIVDRHAEHDLVIRGGTVFDGTGSEGREMDIAVQGGRVSAMARTVPGKGAEEMDARGAAVCPGFIDIHSHGDGTLAEDPRAESVIRQGITTIVVGADGSSRATGAADNGFATMFDSIDRLAPGPNLASMIGLGSVRRAVIGDANRTATPDELSRMRAMVESALSDGACGASSGLEYTPGAFATRDELIAVVTPLAPRKLPYATHMRNEDDRLLDAIDESMAVARGARCPLQISHLKTQGPRNWPKLDDVFRRIEAARAQGLDAAFDRYPYVAYATGLTNLFPVWSRDGGTVAFLARLGDSSVAPRIREETLAKVALIGGWDNAQVTSVRSAEDRDAEGKRLGSYARARGGDPYEIAVGLLQRSQGDVGMVGFAMSEENLDRILSHPLGMVCTDGSAFAIDGPTRRGSPHPRGAGSFPRVLGRYVRDRKVMSLAQAIRKMTSQPASRIRLADRGTLAPRMAGDVVVFDPNAVNDTATFESPFQYPSGIKAVVVNGLVALRDGQRSRSGSGKALRASR
ncbi:MAG: D-aminoacylase [Gemmatimonadaceae bacterium]|nr:D-aminoacylase [Gemmatimonadaceae bacterium]